VFPKSLEERKVRPVAKRGPIRVGPDGEVKANHTRNTRELQKRDRRMSRALNSPHLGMRQSDSSPDVGETQSGAHPSQTQLVPSRADQPPTQTGASIGGALFRTHAGEFHGSGTPAKYSAIGAQLFMWCP